jgi:hypothetical protein
LLLHSNSSFAGANLSRSTAYLSGKCAMWDASRSG